MKLTIAQLKTVILESTDQISSLVVDVPSEIDGHTIIIKQNDDGFVGLVDYGNFGGGKTRRAAETAIRKRLAFLSTNSSTQSRRSGSEIEASMANKELSNRARIERSKKI